MFQALGVNEGVHGIRPLKTFDVRSILLLFHKEIQGNLERESSNLSEVTQGFFQATHQTIDAFFSIIDTGIFRKENLGSPNRSPTFDLLITYSDALPLSYRKLMGARPIN